MKKIFTLLVSVGVLSSVAFAQPGAGKKNDRDNRYANSHNSKRDDRGFDNRKKDAFYFFTPRERDMQIASINREYDYKLNAVRKKFYLFPGEKKKALRNLELQRKSEISWVVNKYNDPRNKGDDRSIGRNWRY
jgi:hypothetical protein